MKARLLILVSVTGLFLALGGHAARGERQFAAATDPWTLGGNAGTTPGTHFVGTTDNQPLQLHVNNARVLRLEPNATSPNLLGGYAGNVVTSGAAGAVIGGGGVSTGLNRVTDSYGTLSGGANNRAGDNAGTTTDRSYATVGGGYTNIASNAYATVDGGRNNTASGFYTSVGGGYFNTASGSYASVGGGMGNRATASYATIGGGARSDLTNAATANRVTDIYGTVSGGGNNQAGDNAGTTMDKSYATVGGGEGNTASGERATVGGGASNTASGLYATVAGGERNSASGWQSTVGGGALQTASASQATIGGGSSNTASGAFATVAGGYVNTASAEHAAVGGGISNEATANWSVVPGGYDNTAAGEHSFAAGTRARAIHRGTFVWADPADYDLLTTEDYQFLVRATGGIWFGTAGTGPSTPDDRLINTSTGAHLTMGGIWANSSDRALKTNLAAVDGRTILDRLSGLPIFSWNYKAEAPSVRHLGPTAQDFAAAFGLGNSDKAIGTVDADGVALAAIQGLNEVVREKDARIAMLAKDNAAQQQQIADLASRLTTLEQSTRAAGSARGSGMTPPVVALVSLNTLVLIGLAGFALLRRRSAPARHPRVGSEADAEYS